VAVRLIRPYVLDVTFADGSRRELDMEPYLDGEVFRPLRDPGFFAEVAIEEGWGTVIWPNGANVSPEFLYYGPDGPPPGYYGEAVEAEPTPDSAQRQA